MILFWILLGISMVIAAFVIFAIANAASLAEHSPIGAETKLEEESRQLRLTYLDNPGKKSPYPSHGLRAPSPEQESSNHLDAKTKSGKKLRP